MSGRSGVAILALASAGLFLAAADGYAVAALLPAMLADTGLPIDRFEQATPIISGFLAGYVVAMPLLGAVSDRTGRVPVYLAALLVFAVGSALTAVAPTLGWLVAGRTVQGLGGGALVPVAVALAADLFAGDARDRAIGAVSAVQEAGSVFGPAYGAAVAAAGGAAGWRAVFVVNLPLAALLGVAVVVAARGTRGAAPAAGGDWRRPFGQGADLLSAAALGLGLGGVTVALYPDDPSVSPVNRYFLAFAAAGVLLLAVYGWRQVRRLTPLVPREVVRSRPFIGALLVNLLVGAGLMAVLVDVPVFARGVFNVDQGQAGVLLTSFLVGVPAGAIAGGLLSSRVGRRAVTAVGLVAAAAGFWVLGTWDTASLAPRVGPLRHTDLELLGLGIAFGLVIAPVAAAALDTAERQAHGIVSSLVVTARTVGMLVALSTLTAFGLYRFRQLLAAQPAPPDSASLHDRLKALEAGVTSALVLEYHDIFHIAAALCIAAAIVAVLTLGRRRPGVAALG